jgi:amylosucrase
LKKMIALRKETPVFADFDNRQLLPVDNANLLIFSRSDVQNPRNRVLVIANFNPETQTIPVDTLQPYGFFMKESMKNLCSGTSIPMENNAITIPPLSCYWLAD